MTLLTTPGLKWELAVTKEYLHTYKAFLSLEF